MNQLKHDDVKNKIKPDEPSKLAKLAARARKLPKWQIKVAAHVTAAAIAAFFLIRGCEKPAPEPICKPVTTVNLPTAEQLRNNGKCDPKALIQVQRILKTADGCDSTVIDTATYRESSDPKSPNYCPDCKAAPKKEKPKAEKPAPKMEAGCSECVGAVMGSEEVAMTLKNRARNATARKAGEIKQALGVERTQSVTITYLVEIDPEGKPTLKGAKATWTGGSKALGAGEVASLTGFNTNSVLVGAPGRCCTVPISIPLPAEY